MLRSIIGELYLGAMCRLLRHPLRSRLVAPWLCGAGFFPTPRVHYARRWGMTMKLDLHDKVPRILYFTSANEPDEMALVKSLLRPDWVVLDIGAHIGSYTLFMAHLLDPHAGRIYAFEPNPSTFALLQYHIAVNSLTHVVPYSTALGAAPGDAELFLARSDNTSMCSLRRANQSDRSVKIRVSTLEQFAGEVGLQRLDFVKLDAEGAEPEIIEGGRAVLTSFRPHILVELNGPRLTGAGYHPRDLALLLQDLGYALFRTDRPSDRVRPDDLRQMDFLNVYCQP